MITIALLLQLVLFSGAMPAMDIRQPMAREDVALEAFEPFLAQFTQHRSFQKKRTLFPLVQWEIDRETEDSTQVEIQKKDWSWLRFDRQGILMPLGGESVEHHLVSQETGMRLEVRGTDSCIATDYIFERRVGKWYLVAMILN